MGDTVFDYYSLCHFLMGFIGYFVTSNAGFSLTSNLLITNGFHFIMELLENNVSPTGKVLEANINHLTDIIFFFLGWYISYYVKAENNKILKRYRYIIWIILIFTMFKEIYREVYPNSNYIIQGAFIENSSSCIV